MKGVFVRSQPGQLLIKKVLLNSQNKSEDLTASALEDFTTLFIYVDIRLGNLSKPRSEDCTIYHERIPKAAKIK